MNLTARPGQVTALVGPNGAGKTTLLLVLATLLVPDEGEVSVAGYDPVTEAVAVRARTGWSPDVFGLYDNLTAREYVEFHAAAYRLPADEGRKRAGELLELAGLTEFANRPVHVLSRGQKQRLALTRTLVHSPEVLLLDEPASGLDPRARVELRDLLRRLAGEGTTVLVSSHVLADLEEVADQVVFIDHGVTVAEQTLTDLASDARRPWRLRALDMDALAAALDGYGIPRADDHAGIDVQLASESEVADLLARLVGDGVRLTACAPVGGALEAAFLALTEERS